MDFCGCKVGMEQWGISATLNFVTFAWFCLWCFSPTTAQMTPHLKLEVLQVPMVIFKFAKGLLLRLPTWQLNWRKRVVNLLEISGFWEFLGAILIKFFKTSTHTNKSQPSRARLPTLIHKVPQLLPICSPHTRNLLSMPLFSLCMQNLNPTWAFTKGGHWSFFSGGPC